LGRDHAKLVGPTADKSKCGAPNECAGSEGQGTKSMRIAEAMERVTEFPSSAAQTVKEDND
jgi:hypothetical protein